MLIVPQGKEGHIQFSVQKPAGAEVEILLAAVQIDSGKQRGKTGQRIRYADTFKVIFRAVKSHAQSAAPGIRPRAVPRDLPGNIPDALGHGKQFPARFKQQSPGGGKRDAAPVTHEQLHSEFPLQFRNLIAERRLGNIQRLGRAAEIQAFRHGNEELQLAQFHGLPRTAR